MSHPHSKTIFLIDDDGDDRMLFAEAVRQVDNSISVITAEDGYDGIQELRKIPTLPDYVFLDMNMPRMNGVETLKEIKKSDKLKNIPVMMCTTSRRPQEVTLTRQLGAAAFITKPLNFEDFIKAIKLVMTQESIRSGMYLNTLVEIF